MRWVEQQKRAFIRWYYGYFVNDPQAETFTFGLHRPLGAMRLTRNMNLCKRNWKWAAAVLVVLVVLRIIF